MGKITKILRRGIRTQQLVRENRSSERRRLTARLPALLLTLAAALAALLLGIVGVGQAQTAASLIEVQVRDVGRSGRGTGHPMKQGAGRCLAVLVLAFLAVILVAAPPEHRAEAQGPNTPATGEVTVTGTARVVVFHVEREADVDVWRVLHARGTFRRGCRSCSRTDHGRGAPRAS